MANYSTLKAAVADVVKTNGTKAITGANLQAVLLSIINSVGGGGYIFKGVATPSTDAGTPDENVFYIGGAGTYANFGTSVTVPVGSICVFKYNGSWTKEQIALFAGIDDVPTANSNKLIKSKGVFKLVQELSYQNVTGNDNTYVFTDIYGLIPSHSYRVYLHNKDYDKSGVTISTAQAWFSGVNVKTDNTQTALFGTYAPDTIKDYYDFVLPTDTIFIRIGGRATAGTLIEFTIEDITEIAPIKNDLSELDKRATGFFIGNGGTLAKCYYYNLVPTHSYRIYPKYTSWDITGATSGNMFSVVSYYNNVETTLAYTLVTTGVAKEYYDFIVPTNSDYIAIKGRAAIGTKVYFEIEDNTHVNSLQTYIEFNSFRYLNQYIFNERQDGSDWPDIGKIISPLIPAVAGDLIELSASSNIAPVTYSGNITSPTTGTSLIITGSTVAGVYVSIIDTDGFWVKKNGATILVWSEELKEQVLCAKRANSLDAVSLQDGLEIIETKTFNGSIGNPANTNYVHTPPIKAGAGASVVCYPNVALPAGQRYILGFTTRTATGSAKRDQSISSTSPAWYNQRVILNESEEYIGFIIGVADSSNNLVPIRKDAYKNVLLYVSKTIAKKPYMENATQLIFTGGSASGSVSHPLTLLHFSDIHGSLASYSRINEFSDYVAPFIDDVIGTGDTVQNSFTDSITFWTNGKFLNVIGNHDTAQYSGGTYNWTYYAGLQAYNKFFAPFIANWGVTQPTDAATNGYCYYYKDYTAKGIRLIALDVMKWDATQLAWFENTLSDAASNSLSVVVASHYPAPTSLVTPMDTNFMSFLGWSGSDGNAVDTDAIEAVDDFITGGGKFVCWIGGHTHRDQIGYLASHNNQLFVIVDTSTTDVNSLNYVDANRVIGEATQDLFNLISFDATEHQVRVVRVGCNTNKQLQTKNTLVISYSADGTTAPIVLHQN